MKTILFVTTIYRIGERIYPIIPELSKHFNIIMFCTHEMAKDSEYAGDINLKDHMKDMYRPFLTQIIENEGMKSYGDMFSDQYHSKMIARLSQIKNVDAVLLDDCRIKPGMDKIYRLFDNIPVFANHHGNSDHTYNHDAINQTCDYLFVFGKSEVKNHQFIPAGIPANDGLKFYPTSNKHILCIVNFLDNRPSPHSINFGPKFVDKSGILKILDDTNLPIVIKLKSRLTNKYRINDLDKKFIKVSFPEKYREIIEIVIDHENDNMLISDSKYVIGSPSTLALKGIQKGIPTVLIKDSGEVGLFKNYPGLVELDETIVADTLTNLEFNFNNYEFISNTIEGGLLYNSTDIYIKSLIDKC